MRLSPQPLARLTHRRWPRRRPARPAVAAPARSAAAAATSSGDDAPFWTGKPNAAQFAKRQEERLALAKAAMRSSCSAVKGTRTIENTLVPYDEVLRQLDMARLAGRA